jgi:regulator of protease activity HflC (stomatin/prohibitin superfamily)
MARYEDLLDEEPLAPRKRGWRSFIWRHLLAVTTSLLVALLMIVVLWPYVVITVPSGRVGAVFDFYCWCISRGTVLDPRELKNEGLHFIWPWDKLFIYDLRLQSSSQTL